MHSGAPDVEISQARAHRVDRTPWAVALNSTTSSDEITLTLLAFAVVDDVLNVSAVVRVAGRADVRLTSIPVLGLSPLDGSPLELLKAHGLPSGPMVWVSWTYRRPADVTGAYEGRVDHVDLVYRAGRIVEEKVSGPWLFAFTVRDEVSLELGGPSGAAIDEV